MNAMSQVQTNVAQVQTPALSRSSSIGKDAALVVSASIFVALCAKISIPLLATPVPLTVQNFAVVLVGLLLGPRRGAAAMSLYLAEGAMGLPVFNPIGVGGIAQIIGPTGGYLMAYPAVAFLAGWIFSRRSQTFAAAVQAGVIAELLLFTSGVSWLMLLTGTSLFKAAAFGLYPFVPAEVLKVTAAAAIAATWDRSRVK